MKQETIHPDIPSQIVDIWQRIVDSISILLSVPSLMINKLEGPELEVFRSNDNPDNPFPSGTRMLKAGVYCEYTARTGKKNRVVDARKDPLWVNSPTAKAGIYAYLGFPVYWPDGKVFGTICAIDTKENQWITPSDSLLLTIKDAVEAHLALVAAMDELSKRNEEVHQLAITDSLTGLYNRRHFFELAEHEFQRARRFRCSLSAIMLDIDFFKKVNDTHGHQIGDKVLLALAECCRESTRRVDVLGRYGGEEFVILLPQADFAATYKIAERLRQSIEKMTIDTEAGPVKVTASFGVSTMEDECSMLETLLKKADSALFKAKRNGRNCICGD
ncbi:MAG: sensor domain-containing diguanylate cyclase [Spirochaetales bacterium]|nr:sensor domain-containing diguanylate cyclase [Spirochaetales bacterium]